MKKILFIIGISLTLMACNQPEKGTIEVKDEKEVEIIEDDDFKADRPEGSNGKFLIKSAGIEFDTEIMGMKQNMLMYFEDYGDVNFVEMKGNVMGMKTHSISIVKDGFEYAIDMLKKTGEKKPYVSENKPEDINFTDLSDEVLKEFNMKKEGTEVFLGRNCDKYTINHSLTKMSGYYLVWLGIPLKTDISMAGLPMKMYAKKIIPAAEVPKGIFDVPEGVKITEVDETTMKI